MPRNWLLTPRGKLPVRVYPVQGDYVIAADRGFDSLVAYGVRPDLAVGDFDSLGHRPNHPNVIFGRRTACFTTLITPPPRRCGPRPPRRRWRP